MTSELLNRDLERSIAAGHDRAVFSVYAHWLQAKGNPRGELASVQLQREVADSSALAEREAALIALHAAAFRGAHVTRFSQWLTDFCTRITWRGGFWREVRFSAGVDELRALLAHPSARLLHSLAITINAEAYEPVVEVLLDAPEVLGGLRSLSLGELPEGQNALAGFGDRTCTNLHRLAAACPRLEVLRLLCPEFSVGEFPSLRHLDARMGATMNSVRALGNARLPQLELVELGFEHADEDERMYPQVHWPDDALTALFSVSNGAKIILWPLIGEASEIVAAAGPLATRLELVNVDDAPDDADGIYTL